MQSVRFSMRESPRSVNRGRGWTRDDARRWLRANDLPARSGGHSKNQYRFRITDPVDGAEYTTRTTGVPLGVQVVE